MGAGAACSDEEGRFEVLLSCRGVAIRGNQRQNSFRGMVEGFGSGANDPTKGRRCLANRLVCSATEVSWGDQGQDGVRLATAESFGRARDGRGTAAVHRSCVAPRFGAPVVCPRGRARWKAGVGSGDRRRSANPGDRDDSGVQLGHHPSNHRCPCPNTQLDEDTPQIR